MNQTLYGWASVQTVDQPFHDDVSFGEMQTKEQHLNEQQRESHQPPKHPENMDFWCLSVQGMVENLLSGQNQ